MALPLFLFFTNSSSPNVTTTYGLWPIVLDSSPPGPGYGVVANSSSDLETTGVVEVTPQNTNNGSGDMTVALQNALKTASAKNTHVQMMPGAYYISQPLVCNFTSIQGAASQWGAKKNGIYLGGGVQIFASAAWSGPALLQMEGGCKIDSILIDATGSNADAVSIVGYNNIVDHSYLAFGVHNIDMIDNAGLSYTNTQILNSSIYSASSDNIYAGYGHANGTIHNCSIFAASSGNGIYFVHNAQWIVTNNYIQQNMLDGIQVKSGTQLQINNNAFDASYHCALNLVGTLQESTVVGNLFIGTGDNQKYVQVQHGMSHICIEAGPNNVTFGQNTYLTQNQNGGGPYPDYVYSYNLALGAAAPVNVTLYENPAIQNKGVFASCAAYHAFIAPGMTMIPTPAAPKGCN